MHLSKKQIKLRPEKGVALLYKMELKMANTFMKKINNLFYTGSIGRNKRPAA